MGEDLLFFLEIQVFEARDRLALFLRIVRFLTVIVAIVILLGLAASSELGLVPLEAYPRLDIS